MNALIASTDGQFIKALPPFNGSRVYGLHKMFGLISTTESEKRVQAVKRKNAMMTKNDWICRFNVEYKDNNPILTPVEGCEVKRELSGWSVVAGNRSWQMSTQAPLFATTKTKETEPESKLHRTLYLLALFLFISILSFLVFWTPDVVEEVEEVIEPVTVMVKQHKTVSVAQKQVNPETKIQPTKRAVPQELGFLGLVGKKDLSKAVGGQQIKLNASAGAGAGGNAGSGGEMLAGLGKGVRATTVGNTGVQGLGGVGTKGKGGGHGGYGDVDIASGEGRGVSSISISQGVGVDGGLDRHVIQATIAKYLSQVRACYEDRLRVNPGLAGTLAMDFEIGGSGRLNYSKVKSSSVGDPQVGSCVATKMMGWEFPKPRGGVNVKVAYPFNLRPVRH